MRHPPERGIVLHHFVARIATEKSKDMDDCQTTETEGGEHPSPPPLPGRRCRRCHGVGHVTFFKSGHRFKVRCGPCGGTGERRERSDRSDPGNTATMAGDEIALPSVHGSAPRISD